MSNNRSFTVTARNDDLCRNDEPQSRRTANTNRAVTVRERLFKVYL